MERRVRNGALRCPQPESALVPFAPECRVLLRPVRLLSAFSISDKGLAFYPTGFPGKGTGKPSDPNSEISAAEQGIKSAHCRTAGHQPKRSMRRNCGNFRDV